MSGTKPKVIKDKQEKAEYAIHKQISQYLDLFLVGFYSSIDVSNGQGGKEGKIKQILHKAKGVKTGLPDIIIHYLGPLSIISPTDNMALQVTIPRALYLEVKSKSGTLSKGQIILHRTLALLDVPVEIVRDLDEVRRALKKHGVLTREASV